MLINVRIKTWSGFLYTKLLNKMDLIRVWDRERAGIEWECLGACVGIA